MIFYKVYDYYEGVELVAKSRKKTDAAKAVSDRILDTDGECACDIELTGSDGTVYAREPDNNARGLSVNEFVTKHPSVALRIYSQVEHEDRVDARLVYKGYRDEEKDRWKKVKHKVFDDIILEFDNQSGNIKASLYLLPERESVNV